MEKREQPAATLNCGLCQALSLPSLLPQPHLLLLGAKPGFAHAHDKAEDGLMPRDGLEVTAMVCHRLRLLEVIKVRRNLSF